MTFRAERGGAQGEEAQRPPWQLTIPEHKDVFVGELAERGEWIVANIQSRSNWPVNAQKVMYRGEAFWIIPVMQGFYPAVAMKVPTGKSRADCEKLIMRFVSNLSWVEDRGLVVEGIGGGSLPVPMGRDKQSGFAICKEFHLSYFPEPASQQALLALALMREGRGLNHPAYAFLSFFRVLEVAIPNGRKRGEWIAGKLGSLQGHGVEEALAELQTKGITDIAAHLYESGRCAIAHANREPIVDPDDPAEYRRLRSELPIMSALAQQAIEEELGVQSSMTVYRKHLYELAGFKRILGPEIVDRVTRGEQIADGRLVSIPNINVVIRECPPYPPLSNLVAKEIAQNGQVIRVRFRSQSADLLIQLHLDFASERLNFCMFDDVFIRDVGTPESADAIAEIRRFQHEYFGNGELHIMDAETGDLIARKDAYIPLNMYLDQDAADADVARWKHLAARRRELNERYHDQLARMSTRWESKITAGVAAPELLPSTASDTRPDKTED